MFSRKNEAMEEVVLSYPPLKARIGGREKELKKAKKNLYEIAADFSPKVIRPITFLMELVIKRLYQGINVDQGEIDFKRFTETNNVVLVPNHQSHADYMALNYIVYRNFKFPLYVAGGINLNIFPIGAIFRKCGCFFIRRSFASDITYKLTLEAYIYYLLVTGKTQEFFFEGGRSRTGKLLSPKFGFFHMILEAHRHIDPSIRKILSFVPVSICHEYIPEQKVLSNELEGGKKKKESTRQLLKLIKLALKEFGSVHIRLGTPINVDKFDDLKTTTHDVAFKTFKSVGKNIAITPSSLLALIMLDEPSGAIQWEDIFGKAQKILSYCRRNNIPATPSLDSSELKSTLENAIDLFISNDKLNVMGRTRFGHVFYAIKEECRTEMMYLKNSILHHLFIPWVINLVWIKIFNGTINNRTDLKNFIVRQRELLKNEFYLPGAKQLLRMVLRITSDAVGRPVTRIDDFSNFSHQDLYRIACSLGAFSRSCSYIYECYFLVAQTLRSLVIQGHIDFSIDQFKKIFKEIFSFEINQGRHVRYIESGTENLRKNCLKYFLSEKIIENKAGVYCILDQARLNELVDSYAKDLSDQLTFNIKA